MTTPRRTTAQRTACWLLDFFDFRGYIGAMFASRPFAARPEAPDVATRQAVKEFIPLLAEMATVPCRQSCPSGSKTRRDVANHVSAMCAARRRETAYKSVELTKQTSGTSRRA